MAKLTNDKLLNIAHDYLEAMGYDNNQYLIVRHHDAEHPRIHVLANRIRFNGSVVNDGNNYAKSEQVVHHLEQRYGLTAQQPSNKAAHSAPKKNEVEMALRTNTLSNKMALQWLLGSLLERERMTLTELIARGEQQGIYFLFNQGANGRMGTVPFSSVLAFFR